MDKKVGFVWFVCLTIFIDVSNKNKGPQDETRRDKKNTLRTETKKKQNTNYNTSEKGKPTTK